MTSPYTPPTTSLLKNNPTSSVTDAYGNALPQLLMEPRTCPAGWGINWITQAFNLLKSNFLLWVGIGVAFFVILMLASFIPIIGPLISFASFIFIGGMIQGCAVQAQGGELRFDHLFEGFKTHFVPLLIMTLLYIVGFIIAFIPMLIILGGMLMSLLSGNVSGLEDLSGAAITTMILAYLLSFAFLIPVLMSIWFAPSLIVLHDVDAITAMKMSFKGCLKNLLSMFIFGLVLMIVLPLGIIFTLGLGVFVMTPLMVITYYTSYRDVWTDMPLSAS